MAEDRVINDPDSLHEYRGDLMEAVQNLQDKLKETEGAISKVNEDGWEDPKYHEFQNNFSEDKEKIKSLYQVVEEYEGLLAKLEEKLRAYGDTSMQINR